MNTLHVPQSRLYEIIRDQYSAKNPSSYCGRDWHTVEGQHPLSDVPKIEPLTEHLFKKYPNNTYNLFTGKLSECNFCEQFPLGCQQYQVKITILVDGHGRFCDPALLKTEKWGHLGIYIAKHVSDTYFDDYIGSGKQITASRYGKHYIFAIFYFETEKEMDDAEKYMISEYRRLFGEWGNFQHDPHETIYTLMNSRAGGGGRRKELTKQNTVIVYRNKTTNEYKVYFTKVNFGAENNPNFIGEEFPRRHPRLKILRDAVYAKWAKMSESHLARLQEMIY